jgi:serine O-acetyltransferase
MMLDRGLRLVRQLKSSIAADYASIRHYRAKYHGEYIPARRLPVDLVQKIGLQLMASVRLMQSLNAAQVPLLPQVVSRLIRHAYGADIHWRAAIEPGVCVVHGTGLVVSHAARVAPGCILFQHVTLGEGIHPETREVGAPRLGTDVHVGPGATLIGPIEIGDRTKIMANAVVTRSVPPDSLVRPAEAEVIPRGSKT